ncbi:DUF6328 family protein [Nocardia otitidiscaviarum]|uniref:DUF6328 family protein n=1 Tax=Nocardia otitidiscaviarum TaxID=1823 RepID=UPI0018943638|nr:DUF6328 family protein [Nocardia otitidiscaviarum]MBF6239332.1 hypothetical protein [Nocardia otitidiscaviarum]
MSNWEERRETEAQRLDRNWNSLVQEARIVQTGVQLLTGFLLILPFQSRFELSDPMRILYLVTVSASIAATVFLVGPVSTHRLLFRRHRLDEVVRAAHLFDLIGVALLGVALTGVAVLIFDVVVGATAGVIAGGVAAALFALVWGIYPWIRRGQGRDVEDQSEYSEPQ